MDCCSLHRCHRCNSAATRCFGHTMMKLQDFMSKLVPSRFQLHHKSQWWELDVFADLTEWHPPANHGDDSINLEQFRLQQFISGSAQLKVDGPWFLDTDLKVTMTARVEIDVKPDGLDSDPFPDVSV